MKLTFIHEPDNGSFIHLEVEALSQFADNNDRLMQKFIKDALENGLAVIKDCDDVGCWVHFKIVLANKVEEEKDKYQGYLLQRFNDYEVPVTMTAEEVRDLLIKFVGEYGK